MDSCRKAGWRGLGKKVLYRDVIIVEWRLTRSCGSCWNAKNGLSLKLRKQCRLLQYSHS
jgi:hypothetical protein